MAKCIRLARAAVCLTIGLAGCASPSGRMTNASPATEMRRQTAALAAEASTEYGKCIALSATAMAQQPSNMAIEPGNIADAALSQCEYLLSEYQNNDRALVLATDPGDGAPFADQHAKQSRINMMSQPARRHAIDIVVEERAKQARQ